MHKMTSKSRYSEIKEKKIILSLSESRTQTKHNYHISRKSTALKMGMVIDIKYSPYLRIKMVFQPNSEL